MQATKVLRNPHEQKYTPKTVNMHDWLTFWLGSYISVWSLSPNVAPEGAYIGSVPFSMAFSIDHYFLAEYPDQ